MPHVGDPRKGGRARSHDWKDNDDGLLLHSTWQVGTFLEDAGERGYVGVDDGLVDDVTGEWTAFKTHMPALSN
jgi:hypothetical protein